MESTESAAPAERHAGWNGILVALVGWQILYDPGRAGMSPSGRWWGGRIRSRRTARIG
ncbi:hypothetical protein [Streptomyces sp. 058-1L]|uniref:hypothetical protein n=1 Tax=Streptomyces sp. 058-1L TaxID=2789266 RepID=UPI003980488C